MVSQGSVWNIFWIKTIGILIYFMAALAWWQPIDHKWPWLDIDYLRITLSWNLYDFHAVCFFNVSWCWLKIFCIGEKACVNLIKRSCASVLTNIKKRTLLPKLSMRRISLLLLAGSHFTHRWSGLQGPLSPSPSASTGCTPLISLPNYGKNLCTNTVEVLISYKIFQRIWLCKWISIFCKTAKYDLLDWERYPVISHQRIRLVCLMLSMLSAEQTKRGGGVVRWWGEVYKSQLRTRIPVALYRLWSCSN